MAGSFSPIMPDLPAALAGRWARVHVASSALLPEGL
jgi:hypothetical protein